MDDGIGGETAPPQTWIDPSLSAPEVSVIIANYNNADFIEQAITSALSQDVASIEVIVVDDNSSDDSVGLVSGIMAREGERVRLAVHAAQRGPGAARNTAIAMARGRWLAILDSDDVMRPGRLSALIGQATAHGADIVADDLTVFYSDGHKPSHRHLAGKFKDFNRSISAVEFIQANNFFSPLPSLGYLKPVWRADRAKAVGATYNPSLPIGEDYDFLLRLLLGGLTFMIVPTSGYFYRRHPNSTSYRTNAAALESLMDANLLMESEQRTEGMRLQRALRLRGESIREGMAFDALVSALKSRSLMRGLQAVARCPKALVHLRLPLFARFGRMGRSIRKILHKADFHGPMHLT